MSSEDSEIHTNEANGDALSTSREQNPPPAPTGEGEAPVNTSAANNHGLGTQDADEGFVLERGRKRKRGLDGQTSQPQIRKRASVVGTAKLLVGSTQSSKSLSVNLSDVDSKRRVSLSALLSALCL